MIFTQHVPTFVEGAKTERVIFNDTEQLLNSKVLKRYKTKDSFFVKHDNCIMVISDNGFTWWVVGFVDKPDNINLPEWEGWKFRARLENGQEVILSDEVVMTSGDELYLQDGTIAKDLSK